MHAGCKKREMLLNANFHNKNHQERTSSWIFPMHDLTYDGTCFDKLLSQLLYNNIYNANF